MQRISTPTRAGWQKTVESQGLVFHSLGDVPYWDESAYYLFESTEIDQIEAATYHLNQMCLTAVGHVIGQRLLGEFGIPPAFHDFVVQSWEKDEQTIYGRFDLVYDGNGPPKLLEYNADTPTALLEAAVIQWFWFQDLVGGADGFSLVSFDQFNSLHERLIEAWSRVGREIGTSLVLAADGQSIEDMMTITYLCDTAVQAGLKPELLSMHQIGWNAARRVFTDLRERPIALLFKLYPWEWMIREAFGRNVLVAPTRWLEPPWKMILSNKAILAVLYELFPDSPYLLATEFEPFGETYVAKPFYSREGANIEIVHEGEVVAATEGSYATGPRVYQEFWPLPSFGKRHPVIGSWVVNGHACGIGIREDDTLITTNSSRFVPHLFRKSSAVKPLAVGGSESLMLGGAGALGRADASDPLWDPWLDR